MKSTNAPAKRTVPFGTNGLREAITATTPSGSNQASYDVGFPPITMTLKSAGGLPPKGQDMNQILFEQDSFNRYFAAGGGYVYDSAFSTAVGGYPMGARVPNSTSTGFWFNTVEDNQNNPENTTSALTGWIPMGSYGVTNISGLTSSSITLTTLQASKDRITLLGTLTANINIVVPAWIKSWTIVNATSGNFTVTVKTASGTGVAIPAGLTAQVFGDGTNVVQDSFLFGISGRVLNVQTFTATGTYTPTPGVKTILIEMVGGGGGGGNASSSASDTVGLGSGGGGGGYVRSYINAIASQLITVGTGGTAGNAGGDTGVGALIARGGAAGASRTAQTWTFASQGVIQQMSAFGGQAANGNIINAAGSYGSQPLWTVFGNGTSGAGGGSFFSGTTAPVSGQAPGTNGAIGCGGAGAAANGTTTIQAGGKGGTGFVIITEYA